MQLLAIFLLRQLYSTTANINIISVSNQSKIVTIITNKIYHSFNRQLYGIIRYSKAVGYFWCLIFCLGCWEIISHLRTTPFLNKINSNCQCCLVELSPFKFSCLVHLTWVTDNTYLIIAMMRKDSMSTSQHN